MVLGARPRRRAIAEQLSPCARPRLASSRSSSVRRRYSVVFCIRVYCTHTRCVKCLTPSLLYLEIIGVIQNYEYISSNCAGLPTVVLGNIKSSPCRLRNLPRFLGRPLKNGSPAVI